MIPNTVTDVVTALKTDINAVWVYMHGIELQQSLQDYGIFKIDKLSQKRKILTHFFIF